jgi:hypothetical protein
VFGHGCVFLFVMEGNRPLVSRFPPYVEIRADVVASFFFSVFQIIKTGWKQFCLKYLQLEE